VPNTRVSTCPLRTTNGTPEECDTSKNPSPPSRKTVRLAGPKLTSRNVVLGDKEIWVPSDKVNDALCVALVAYVRVVPGA
jgi:hypothetical protein